MSTPADAAPVTVAELLDQTTERLDGMCHYADHDPGLFELWRIVATLNAAVKQLAAEKHPNPVHP